MRRGATLVELVTSMAIIAALLAVVLRLVFLSDRALGAQERRGREVAGAARLLADVSTDLRSARSARGGDGRLVLAGRQDVTYSWSDDRQAVVRRVAGQPNEDRLYPGARFTAPPAGRLVRVHICSGRTELATAVGMRR